MPISTSGLTLDAKTLPILPLQLAQGFSSFWDLSPPTRGVRFIGDLAWVLSPVLCVCVACLCVSGTRVWVTRSPDVTQGMPAVEGDDCRGQVGLRTQDWGSPWGWKQGGGPLCWGGGAVASASGLVHPLLLPAQGHCLSVGVLGDRAALSQGLVHCSFWNEWGLAAGQGQGPQNSGWRGAHRFPWSGDVCRRAASGVFLVSLNWLQGCPAVHSGGLGGALGWLG